MADIFRDTALGVVLRYITRNRVLLYPEEQPNFKIPELWQQMLDGEVVPEAGENEKPVDQMTMLEATRSAATEKAALRADEENQAHAAGSSSSSSSASSSADDIEQVDNEPYAALRRASTARSAAAGSLAPARSGVVSVQRTRTREETLPFTQARLEADALQEVQRTQSLQVVPRLVRTRTQKDVAGGGGGGAVAGETSAIVVDWYTTDDRANPFNWTTRRRTFVAFIIWLYTFVVYMSSAIYINSTAGVMESFGVGPTKAALGLALFVLGYGVGPLLFSPLSEIPSIGRNPVYAITMALFLVVSLPTALAFGNLDGGKSSGTFAGLMVLRFLQGFFGSPCLASGAATLGDMFSMMHVPYALVAWVSAGFCAPALGPLLSGFSVPAKGWRWSLLEILWAAAPITVLMLVSLPETSGPAILLRRARRLRALTGSDRFVAPSEVAEYEATHAALTPQATGRSTIATAASKTTAIVIDALIKPIEITIKDPAVLFVQVYTAIVYGIYYSFFEAFALVYPVSYGMTPGQVGLVFTCILVACLLGMAIYLSYVHFVLNRRVRATGEFPPNEDRLIPAMVAAFGPTIGLFIFAWTAANAPQVPWIAPTIGITLYGATVFVVLQCVFVYIPLSYPQYAASLFAANDFMRAAFACGAVLFGRPLYINLGIGRGTSLLGGLSTIGIVGIWLLYFYGARLRAMSKFAVSS